MDKNPESKLIQTLNTQAGDDLSMTSKPVLVQNQLGIFFGFLKKADTRKGTALLSDGYAIDPKKHLTFTQYLRFICSEDEGHALSMNTVRRVAHENTITDYATEGIGIYHVDSFNTYTGYYDAPNGIEPTVAMLSLTGIYAIVPVNDDSDANYMWSNMINYNEINSAESDQIDITVKETFTEIGTIGRGLDGSTYSREDGTVREVMFSSAVIRPLVIKETT